MIFEDADSIQCYPNVELKHIDRLISIVNCIALLSEKGNGNIRHQMSTN